jgi:hypothetical protein
MDLSKILRFVLITNVLTMLLQATFAGRMLGGDIQSASLHESAAKLLVVLACIQLALAIALKIKKRCPVWIPIASGGLLIAEVLEFAAGHVHNVALHVPLGMAIFGGMLRQLLWSMRDTSGGSELAR